MVDIAVCEMESKNAPCKALKLQLVKVMVNKEDFTDLQEFDEIVTIEDAQKAFPDFEAFKKRNRFSKNCLKKKKWLSKNCRSKRRPKRMWPLTLPFRTLPSPQPSRNARR